MYSIIYYIETVFYLTITFSHAFDVVEVVLECSAIWLTYVTAHFLNEVGQVNCISG